MPDKQENTYVQLEKEGVEMEELRRRKETRRGAKSAVTRKENELTQLLTDSHSSEISWEVIDKKVRELTHLMESFTEKHKDFHTVLEDETDQSNSQQYLEDVEAQYTATLGMVKGYRQLEKSDVSDVTMNTVKDTGVSPRSTKSVGRRSVASSRAKVKLREAMMLAEASVLEEQHDIEAEQLRLSQRRELQAMEEAELRLRQRSHSLQLKMEIARVRAEEEAMTDMDGESEELCGRQQEKLDENLAKMTLENVTSWVTAVDKVVDFTPRQVPVMQPVPPAEQDGKTTDDTFLRLLSTMQLPKAEMMTFSGDPLHYWTFVRAFENTVDRDTVDDRSKLMCLLQYCVGKAKKVIQCCLAMEPSAGYAKARAILKERFGNGYVIAEAWIGKVSNGAGIRPNDGESLQDFADDLQNCRETLSANGHLAEVNVQTRLVKIIARLPSYLQNRWRREAMRIRQRDRNPTIDDVNKFVQEAAKEATDPVYGQLSDARGNSDRVRSQQNRSHGSSYNTSASYSAREPPRRLSCHKCGGNHSLFGCDAFKSMRPEERIKLANDKRLCFNCLRPGHMSGLCGLNRTCSVPGCGKKHTKFLHPIKREESTTDSRESTVNQGSNGFVGAENNNSVGRTDRAMRVVLPIVPVTVKATDSDLKIDTYALLDSGSTHSFCSEELARKLNLKGKPSNLSLTTLEKAESITKTTVVSFEVYEKDGTNVVDMPCVYTRPEITISLDNMAKSEDIEKWSHLRDLELPSVDTKKVMLLIGQDSPEALMPRELRQGGKGEPYATKTLLGWTLNGPLGITNSHKATANFIHTDSDLDTQLEKFWRIEGCDLVDDKVAMSHNDRKALHVWEDSLIQNSDSHYEAAIPFKERPPTLPYNRYVAEQRLEGLKGKLSRDSVLHQSYQSFMSELLDKCYAEKVDTEREPDGPIWYLPHHSVVHPKKPDKVRVVFDCAARYGGISLNDQVLQGPDLTRSLIGVLLRFRQEHIAVMADIEAMFHQVRVALRDRDALRFLWWPDGDLQRQPEEYRMTAHLFGGTWSPSCCNFVLQHTARVNKPECDQETVETVLRNFYVDDCLKSVSSVETAVNLVSQLRDLLASGGFKLTKWTSNERKVLANIPEDDRAKEVKGLDLNYEALPVERALGVYWDTETDNLCYKIEPKDKPLTRRGILSVVSSVYDPLGLAGPFILPAKMIIQDLTRLKLGWDEPIPEHQLEKWSCWRSDLPKMEQFRTNRCVKPHVEIVECQLHYFSDASEAAYGATAYLLMTDIRGQKHCSLLMAKSRLAPIKKMTIPRLELMAATLSVKLDNTIRRELEIPVTQSVFWTDSTTVLRYINSEDKRFHTFVANRVAMIRDGSEPSQWHFVDTKSNPADDASRGMTADEFLANERWLDGPAFLKQGEDMWPTTPTMNVKVSDTDLEVKTNVCVVADTQELKAVDILIERRSSWYKLKRDVAWWLRLKEWLKGRANGTSETVDKGALTVDEIDKAGVEIVKYVQGQHFSDEIKSLAKPETNKAKLKSSTIMRLTPVLSSSGVLVVGGRLQNAPIPEEAKHQMILPKHHVADLVTRHYHETSGHSGREHVLSLLRQHFWVIGGRTTVRRVLHDCFDCKRRAAPCGEQKMADLPVDRVTPENPPFTFVGVDFFGTFLVKRGRSLVKRYGCIFTCFAVRAIHIEVAHSLDTDSFINALQRFICRRGQPEMIYSDNGTNFVAGERELREAVRDWNQNKIEQFLKQRGIKWKFNPPAASHMGGAWERQIRTVRKVLGALTKEQNLDDEGLSTLLCLVEAIVNGRPLTTVSDDARDPEPLTPNHLLLLRSGPTLPPGQFNSKDLYSRKRWRQIQYMADIFWKRWTKEYLPTLQRRQRWLEPSRNFDVDDVVLVVDHNTHRNMWPMARVIKVYPGKDGYVRSVEVKTSTSILRRPITKLCLLEAIKRDESTSR